MPIDTSMYQNMRGIDLGQVANAYNDGLKMSDMIKQRRDQEAQREAYKAGAVVGPDGKTTFDPSLTASALAKGGFGKEAMELSRQADTDKRSTFEWKMKQADLIGQVAGGIKDQPSYDKGLKFLSDQGVDISPMPKYFDQDLVNSYANASKSWLDQQTKTRELDIKEREAGRRSVGDPIAKELQAQRLDSMKRKAEEDAFKKTPEGRIQHLGTESKQRLDNAKLGMKTVQDMADALLRGDQNTFSVFGDNDFTQARSLFEEALGRMQSGGAISKPEEERFKAMAPTWRDSPAMQKKKLETLQAEMKARIGTLGFKPQEVGVSEVNLRSLKPGMTGSGIDQANAAPAPRVFKTNEIDWAE